MCVLIVLGFIVSLFYYSVADNTTAFYNDNRLDFGDQSLNVLSGLSLDRLIKMKNSIGSFEDKNDALLDDNVVNHNISKNAEALALFSRDETPPRRTDIFSKKGKGGKVNTLFMISVTTLAFLAFGGYLLCLIVQAIKGKGNLALATNSMNSQPVMIIAGNVKKKRPQINYGRRKRDLWDDEALYYAMVKLAEGYASWHGVYAQV